MVPLVQLGLVLFDYDANFCTFVGWLILAAAVPAIAIFLGY